MKRATKIKNRIFAMPAAAAAIPPNPNKAATSETMKNTNAQYNMGTSFLRGIDVSYMRNFCAEADDEPGTDVIDSNLESVRLSPGLPDSVAISNGACRIDTGPTHKMLKRLQIVPISRLGLIGINIAPQTAS